MKPRSKKNFLLDLARTCKTGKELLTKAGEAQFPKGSLVSFQILISPLDILSFLSKKAGRSSTLSFVYSNDNLSVFSLKRQIGSTTVIELAGHFALARSKEKGVFLIISIAPNLFWKYGVLWYFRKLVPNIAFLFLKQKEMKYLLTLLSRDIPDAEIRLTKIVSKGRILAEGARKRSETDIGWTDLPLDDAFHKAEEENHWFKTVNFELIVKKPEGLFIPIIGRMSKYSSIMCEKGIDIVTSTIFSEVVQIAQKKLNLLYNRSREQDPHHKAKPLAIEYATDVFKDPESNKFFIQTIKKLANISCAVFHGNPYIHMSVADYTDGSSYDLWVVNPKRIVIVPQIRATEGSLSRLTNHIFEQFKEGEIIEGAAFGE